MSFIQIVFFVNNNSKVMFVKKDYIKQSYGIRDEDAQFLEPFSYKHYCKNVLDKRF